MSVVRVHEEEQTHGVGLKLSEEEWNPGSGEHLQKPRLQISWQLKKL